MGLMRWLRGGEENSAATGVISAGLAEIDALFRPSKHKQTEHVQETRRRRVDVHNGAGVDLDLGVAVIRRGTGPTAPAGTPTGPPAADATPTAPGTADGIPTGPPAADATPTGPPDDPPSAARPDGAAPDGTGSPAEPDPR